MWVKTRGRIVFDLAHQGASAGQGFVGVSRMVSRLIVPKSVRLEAFTGKGYVECLTLIVSGGGDAIFVAGRQCIAIAIPLSGKGFASRICLTTCYNGLPL